MKGQKVPSIRLSQSLAKNILNPTLVRKETAADKPGVGVLIDTEIIGGSELVKSHPYFITIDGYRYYGSTPEDVVHNARNNGSDDVTRDLGLSKEAYSNLDAVQTNLFGVAASPKTKVTYTAKQIRNAKAKAAGVKRGASVKAGRAGRTAANNVNISGFFSAAESQAEAAAKDRAASAAKAATTRAAAAKKATSDVKAAEDAVKVAVARVQAATTARAKQEALQKQAAQEAAAKASQKISAKLSAEAAKAQETAAAAEAVRAQEAAKVVAAAAKAAAKAKVASNLKGSMTAAAREAAAKAVSKSAAKAAANAATKAAADAATAQRQAKASANAKAAAGSATAAKAAAARAKTAANAAAKGKSVTTPGARTYANVVRYGTPAKTKKAQSFQINSKVPSSLKKTSKFTTRPTRLRGGSRRKSKSSTRKKIKR